MNTLFPGRLSIHQRDDGPDLWEWVAYHYWGELWVRRHLRHPQPSLFVLQWESRNPYLEVQLEMTHLRPT